MDPSQPREDKVLGRSQRPVLAGKRLDVHTEASSGDVRLLGSSKKYPQLPKGLDRMHGKLFTHSRHGSRLGKKGN